MASVLPLLGGILNAAAKIGEYVVPPIKRQVNYMCCYNNNIKDLEDEVGKLDDIKYEVTTVVDAAKRNLQIIAPRVKKWLLEVEKIREKKNALSEDASRIPQGCIYGMCPNLKLRYRLSRRAKKMTEKSIQLRDEGKFERVSYPPPPMKRVQYPAPTLRMDPPAHQIERETIELDGRSSIREFFEERIVAASQGNDASKVDMNTSPIAPFESDNRFRTRKFMEERIVDALQDPNVSLIGLCGLGGVGKTTMVARIEEIVKGRKMFDEVVTVVVTQQQDSSKIQNSIAEMLGLKLDVDDLRLRAIRIHNRIMNEKCILVILDDIWERLGLTEIGIPTGIVDCPCKILLTSRARDVCIQMGAQKILSLEVLSGDEAWILFSEEAGISNDFSHLYAIGKEVAYECKGLPIALLSVARALKGRGKPSWEDALVQLKRSIPTNIVGVQTNVYRPLELSYSHLEGNEAKSLFILCSLFDICIEDLVRYGIGMSIFNGILTFREGRNRVHALIDILKDRFLLADGHKEGYVKMHNVARDVAISVRSKDENVSMITGTEGWWSLKNSYEHCTHACLLSSISTRVPTWVNCPNLIFLLWDCNNQKLTDIEHTFNKLTTLHVLDIRCVVSLEIPSSLQQLTNLRVLRFYNCKLQNISMIGYLVNLEILSFQGSDINRLPMELGKLGKLRLLDLTECENLLETPSNVIARLVKLEELYLPKSFKVCDIEKLEHLHHLTTLRIVIGGGPMYVSREMHVFSKLEEYDISIGDIPPELTRYCNISNRDKRSFQKGMGLVLPIRTPLGEWIITLLENAEDLRLAGHGLSSIMLKPSLKSQYLRQLALMDCPMEHLATTTNDAPPKNFQILPVLQSLFLYRLLNMKEICHGELPERSFGELRYLHLRDLPTLKHFCSGSMRNVSLCNLRFIYIYSCPDLASLFCMSVAGSLLHLEELEVGDCQEMKLVFSNDGEDDRIGTSYIEFPKLNKLVLKCLHRATSFVTVNKISFPQLMQLKIQALPQFKGFCSTKSNLEQILFNEKVVCPRITRLALESLNKVSNLFSHQQSGFLQNLLFLEVDACQTLTTMFSPSVARALVKLKELRIRNCRMLVDVLGKENGACMKSSTNASCCSQTPALFSELEFLEVYACPKLQSLLPFSVAQGLVKLKELRVISCNALVEVLGKDEQEQMNINIIPFPQLRTLQLSSLPSVKSFCNTNCDFEIPSLRNVKIDKNSPLTETLMKVAKNAEQMIRQAAGQNSSSAATAYASCQSHICQHEEEM